MRSTSFQLQIDAPDGAAALELERRLAHLNPTTLCRHDRWMVEVDTADALSEIQGVVAGWLRELGEAETTVRVDGHPVHVEAEARPPLRRHRATNASFVG